LNIFNWIYYSDLKRQAKAQKKAEEKAQKATAAPQQPSAKKAEATAAAVDGENDEQDIDPNVSLLLRSDWIYSYDVIIRNITRCDCIIFKL